MHFDRFEGNTKQFDLLGHELPGVRVFGGSREKEKVQT